jgi:hypothetical protein
MRKPQQADEAAEVAAAAGAQRGFQAGGVPVTCDDVRVGMFFPASGAVKVADQPGQVLAARADLPDHLLTGPRPPGRAGGTPFRASPDARNATGSVPGRAERRPFRPGPRGTRSGMRSAPGQASTERGPLIPDRRNAARIPVRPADGAAWERG